jgi:EAL domain-containing protein (putative c-di-GMP-specific phosphodiesterase class I)
MECGAAMIKPSDVSAAMDRGELFIEYLPTVMLSNRRCVGGEALVRWRRDGAVLQPRDFLSVIEHTPLSGTLTYWVIDTVATELSEWLAENPEVQIGINVPPEILGRGGIEYAARRSGLRARADQIVLEITERGVPDRLGLAALNAMAERGVHVALDDVVLSGVNLALLTRCSFSIVKIDRTLTAQLVPGAPQPEWLAGLTSLLSNSTLQVIAEGIESRYQSQTLLEAGVQMGQGFLFSSPLIARDLKRFHAASGAA